MNIATLNLSDLVGVITGFSITVLVFSYLLGDNPLFRFVLHIFIGVAAGYAGIVAIYSVLLPRLVMPLLSDNTLEQVITLLPLLLSGLLLTKISPRLARLGNVSMAFLVGVGAAAAIGGAVTGTVIPQVSASINQLDLEAIRKSGINLWLQVINSLIILLGTITTLAYFHFGAPIQTGRVAQRRAWIDGLGRIGQIFIAITFGMLFAGVYAAALTALIERVVFLVSFIKPLIQPFIG